jgi:hypothetical protein
MFFCRKWEKSPKTATPILTLWEHSSVTWFQPSSSLIGIVQMNGLTRVVDW